MAMHRLIYRMALAPARIGVLLLALVVAAASLSPVGATTTEPANPAEPVPTVNVGQQLPVAVGPDLPVSASGSLAGPLATRLLERQPALTRNPYSLLVEFDKKADPAAVEELLLATGSRLVRRFTDSNLYQVETSRDLAEVRAEFSRSEQIVSADFDATVRSTARTTTDNPQGTTADTASAGGAPLATNDPYGNATSMWGLFGTHGINAEAAWAEAPSLSDVVVAVIDSGVDITHGDLASRIWTNPGEIAGNGIDDDNNGFIDDIHGWDFVEDDAETNDPDGHGTHVAGTIAAVRDNGRGVAGVTSNAVIMPLRFLNASGNGYVSDALSALDYALDNGARISNNSWGGGSALSAFSAALDRANSLGHLFVAAAGNDGSNIDFSPTYPASYPQTNVLTVAATQSSDGALASFSNYGTTSVDVAAPGRSILSTFPRSFAGMGSTVVDVHGDVFATLNGTSMAAPHVAGLASLLLGLDPDLNAQELSGLITDGGRTRSNLSTIRTSRTIDAAGSMALLNTPPPTIAISGAANGDELFTVESITLTATATSGAGSDISDSVQWQVSPSSQTGSGSTFTFSSNNPGDYTLTATVAEANGRAASTSIDLTVLDLVFRFTEPDEPFDLSLGNDLTARWGWPGAASTTANLELLPIYRYAVTPEGSTGAINDYQTTSVSLNVPDDFTARTVNLGLRLSHTYMADLTIRLTHPSGRTITLFQEHGSSGNNLGSDSADCNGELTYFSSSATESVDSLTPPYVGPVRPIESLAAFNDLSPVGEWRLDVSDGASQDTGSIHCMELDFTNASAGSRLESDVNLTGGMVTIDNETLLANSVAPESRLVLNGSGVTAIASWGTVVDETRAAPSPPRSVAAEPNGTTRELRVTWTAPLSRGGGPISGYRVLSGTTSVCEAGALATNCTVRDLAAGSSYQFTVVAVNEFGSGEPSASTDPAQVPKIKTSNQVGVDCYSPQTHQFNDVSENLRVTNDVGCIAQLGVTTGCNPAAGLYCPGNPVLRKEMAAFLTRLNTIMISDGCQTSHPFTDVTSGWAQGPIGCIFELGITIGTSPTTYGPGESVTREQMAAFLARYLNKVNGEECTGSHPFTDVTSAWAQGPIGCIFELGITTGTSPTTYSPKDPVTREQMASFLARLYRELTA